MNREPPTWPPGGVKGWMSVYCMKEEVVRGNSYEIKKEEVKLKKEEVK